MTAKCEDSFPPNIITPEQIQSFSSFTIGTGRINIFQAYIKTRSKSGLLRCQWFMFLVRSDEVSEALHQAQSDLEALKSER